MTDRARKSLDHANRYARMNRHPLITSMHVMWGLCEEGNNTATKVLKNLNVEPERIKDKIYLEYGSYRSGTEGIPYSVDAQEIIVKAADLGVPIGHIGCHHLLQAMLMTHTPAGTLLRKLGLTEELVLSEIKALVKLVY